MLNNVRSLRCRDLGLKNKLADHRDPSLDSEYNIVNGLPLFNIV